MQLSYQLSAPSTSGLFCPFVFLGKKNFFFFLVGLSPLSSSPGRCFRDDTGWSSCVLGSLNISHYSSNVWGLTKPQVHLAMRVFFPWLLNTCGFYGKFHPCVFDSFTLNSSKCCCVRSLWCPGNFELFPLLLFLWDTLILFFLETGSCRNAKKKWSPASAGWCLMEQLRL